MIRDERAVSEVLAFILVFAIVIASVGLLTVTGFDSMRSYQEGEQLRNAERAMSALANNLNDVQRGSGVPERSGELALRDGTVTVDGGGTELEVVVEESGTEVFNDTATLGSVAYEKGSSTIAYEGGAVFRGESSGNVVLDRPQLSCNENAAVVSVVVVEPDEERSLQSSEALEIRSIKRQSNVTTYADGDYHVDLSVSNSSYENGWETVLDGNGWKDGSCTDVDRVTIRITYVDVELSR